MVSSQVLGGSDFLTSRSTSEKVPSDNQIAGQAQYPPPPPEVQQELQQYYQYYQPAATEQQHQYQPEYYQQQEQQYGHNFHSVADKQVGIRVIF